MITALTLLLALLLGGMLAALYFGGLWWTVRQLTQTSHPGLVYFASFFIRLAVLLVSFYLVINLMRWPALLACLFGFVVVRFWLLHRMPVDEPTDPSGSEVV